MKPDVVTCSGMDRGSQMKRFDLRISHKEWDKYKSIDLAMCNFFFMGIWLRQVYMHTCIRFQFQ